MLFLKNGNKIESHFEAKNLKTGSAKGHKQRWVEIQAQVKDH